MVVFKELIFNSFYFGQGLMVLKELNLSTVSTLGGCGCLVRTDLYQFLLKEGVVVMKELISTVCYYRMVLWSSKN